MLVLRRPASEKTAIHVLQFEVGIFNGFSYVGLYGGSCSRERSSNMVKSTKRPVFSLAKQTILPWRPLIKYKQGLVCSVHPCGEPAPSHFVCWICGLSFQTKSGLTSHSKFDKAHLGKVARVS